VKKRWILKNINKTRRPRSRLGRNSVTRYFARQLLNKHAKNYQNVEKITKFLLSTKVMESHSCLKWSNGILLGAFRIIRGAFTIIRGGSSTSLYAVVRALYAVHSSFASLCGSEPVCLDIGNYVTETMFFYFFIYFFFHHWNYVFLHVFLSHLYFLIAILQNANMAPRWSGPGSLARNQHAAGEWWSPGFCWFIWTAWASSLQFGCTALQAWTCNCSHWILNNRLCHSGVFGWISCDNQNITNF
jgi:hypothetical protein